MLLNFLVSKKDRLKVQITFFLFDIKFFGISFTNLILHRKKGNIIKRGKL